MPANRHYLYTIRMTRPAMLESPTPEEQRILADHFAYLHQQSCQGTVLLAGPCVDGAFGIVLIVADSEEAARRFMAHDPAVQRGVMRGELHPFRIAILASQINHEGPDHDCT